jgi:hypothetical protein
VKEHVPSLAHNICNFSPVSFNNSIAKKKTSADFSGDKGSTEDAIQQDACSQQEEVGERTRAQPCSQHLQFFTSLLQ